MSRPLVIRPVRGRGEMRSFLNVPWKIYADDVLWVPPLRTDVQELLNPARHPFYGGGAGAQRELFVAWDGARPVGRIAAIFNPAHNRYHSERVGFFGFFEFENRQEIASGLLRAAGEWLKRFKLTAIRGPVNPSTNYECGLLVDGFHRPPAVMMPHNPPYYAELLETFGLVKAKDLYAYFSAVHPGHLDRLGRVTDRVRRRFPELSTRGGDLRNFDQEVRNVQEVYNAAWQDNWGFIPMSEGEIEFLARELKRLVYAPLLRFAFVDDEPVGFLLALPDWNPVLKQLNGSLWRRPFRTLRVLLTAKPERLEGLRLITMGVKERYRKRGIEAVLFHEGLTAALEAGFEHCEYSWILEDNEMTKGTVKVMDAELDKIYRIYEKAL